MTRWYLYPVVAVLVFAAALTFAVVSYDTPRSSTPTTIYEDDPRWDCHTMGNRICGPGHQHPNAPYLPCNDCYDLRGNVQ